MDRKPHTESEKRKISEGLKRFYATHPHHQLGKPSWNKGGTSWSRGKHLSEAHRAAIGAANRRAYANPALRKAISDRMMGAGAPSWKGGQPHCVCGQVLRWGKVRCRKCYLATRPYDGEKSNFWRGGVSVQTKTERQRLMARTEYKAWRKSVFGRDNYTCQMCGVRGGTLHADHIKSFADYPELRFDINNGRTLCVPCHRKTPNYGGGRKAKLLPE